MRFNATRFAATLLVAACVTATAGRAAAATPDDLHDTVTRHIAPLMKQYAIPGMAVGIVADGKPYVFDYGVMSTQTGKPVTGDTLFEIGSVSKTLTATLAADAQEGGELSLADPVGKYLPALQGKPFGVVTLLDLGTHTSGGMPVQVPDSIRDDAGLIRYLDAWRPAHAPGTYRTYSNVSVGMLGWLTAKAMHKDFAVLMEQRLFPALGMTHTYINVPEARQADYAQGYTQDGKPIQMTGGMLWQPAYGVRTTAADLLRFVQANMGLIETAPRLQRALERTHTGYFRAGPLTQDLIWEQYPYPVALPTLLEGNSMKMLRDGLPASAIKPPLAPSANTWINKTGSTNGFSTYVAFVPSKRIAIVMLANRSFPNEDRVKAAYGILGALDGRR
ncbi:class C beta-lactamase [Burkholderia cepacia]|uniref:class C beta-lactamase n=1 Tax=Burkholderia cepacia TaxID=292 RepID=UPI0007533119|nr:class C beta-lactamase [Burkholderia cepacia]KVA65083.1 class C beta-lactamase [Burkholderia cepacia]KVA66299.1 class C beta-lactamase [Burkholderia cepacia]KVA85124.1 class C beta-lactamase [Burkholderia cepacia]KVA86324.1 class C beta-lactamase [Burkholderia cepacia]KVA89839.1 class C beta-lactamase [Burkholderia cepacia]